MYHASRLGWSMEARRVAIIPTHEGLTKLWVGINNKTNSGAKAWYHMGQVGCKIGGVMARVWQRSPRAFRQSPTQHPNGVRLIPFVAAWCQIAPPPPPVSHRF